MNEEYELWNVWGVITKYLDVVSLKQHQSVYPARAMRAGPKGLRAESARAVTGRRESHRGGGGKPF